MEEGIMDLNLPMNFFRQAAPAYAADYANWNLFLKDHRYSRHVVIGPALYLNTLSNGLVQVRDIRTPTAKGNRADGICLYSYSVPPAEERQRPILLKALAQRSESNPDPIFAEPVSAPEMPWKTKPTKGHLKGFVYGVGKTNALDGATLELTGPAQRAMRSDATGFYGAVDLPPGDYRLTAWFQDFAPSTNAISITAGKVANSDLILTAKKQ